LEFRVEEVPLLTIHPLRPAGSIGLMASTNKCLAQINKSGTDSNATNKFTVERRNSCAGQVTQRQDQLRLGATG
jgi:hypothetical protein